MAAHGGKDFETVSTGKHDIQNDQIKGLILSQIKTFFAGAGQRDVVVFRLQTFFQGLTELRLIFDRQNPHASTFI